MTPEWVTKKLFPANSRYMRTQEDLIFPKNDFPLKREIFVTFHTITMNLIS